jgi:small subunit ribosomal protein S6
MPLYENIFIARQDISGPQVEALIETFSTLLTENGGSVSKKEYWGLKNLSFRIQKNRKGHYALLNIDAPPAAITELERTMRINEDILRYMTIRVDELEEGPSAAMQNKGGREERPRRGFGDRGERGGFGDRERGGFGDRGDRGFAGADAATGV